MSILSLETSIRVRYADTDKMGIVYNSVYLVYFEVGRTELMRAHNLPYTEFEKAGYHLPLIEAKVIYKKAAYYDDFLIVNARLDTEKITARLQFDYKIERNGELIAEGYTIHSFMNSTTKRAVKPPEIFLRALGLNN